MGGPKCQPDRGESKSRSRKPKLNEAQVCRGRGVKHPNVATVSGEQYGEGARTPALLVKRRVQHTDVLQGFRTKMQGLNCGFKRKGG